MAANENNARIALAYRGLCGDNNGRKTPPAPSAEPARRVAEEVVWACSLAM